MSYCKTNFPSGTNKVLVELSKKNFNNAGEYRWDLTVFILMPWFFWSAVEAEFAKTITARSPFIKAKTKILSKAEEAQRWCVIQIQLTQALEEATEFVGSFIDVHTKLGGEEGQGLRTNRGSHHLVLWRVTLLRGNRETVNDNTLYKLPGFLPISKRVPIVCCTLFSARARSSSSRFCWEILRVSSSETQPSQERQALSNTWEASVIWERTRGEVKAFKRRHLMG